MKSVFIPVGNVGEIVILSADEYTHLLDIQKKYTQLINAPVIPAIMSMDRVPVGPGDGLVRAPEEKDTYYKSSSYPWKCAVPTCPNPIYFTNTDSVKICTSCHRNGVTAESLKKILENLPCS